MTVFPQLSLVPVYAPQPSLRAHFSLPAFKGALSWAMYSDQLFHTIFTQTKTIAVVGMSKNPARPSHYVSQFLVSKGYRVVPVNPGLAGQSLLNETVFATLADIPFDVEMVDIFRRPDAVPDIVDTALASWPNLQTIWMQIGVTHAQAAEKATARGVTVIQDRCPKVEFPRLFGSQLRSDLALS